MTCVKSRGSVRAAVSLVNARTIDGHAGIVFGVGSAYSNRRANPLAKVGKRRLDFHGGIEAIDAARRVRTSRQRASAVTNTAASSQFAWRIVWLRIQ